MFTSHHPWLSALYKNSCLTVQNSVDNIFILFCIFSQQDHCDIFQFPHLIHRSLQCLTCSLAVAHQGTKWSKTHFVCHFVRSKIQNIKFNPSTAWACYAFIVFCRHPCLHVFHDIFRPLLRKFIKIRDNVKFLEGLMPWNVWISMFDPQPWALNWPQSPDPLPSIPTPGVSLEFDGHCPETRSLDQGHSRVFQVCTGGAVLAGMCCCQLHHRAAIHRSVCHACSSSAHM